MHALALVFPLSLNPTIAPDVAPAVDDPPLRPWEHVHAWLSEERDRFAEDLASAHAALLPRAEAEDQDLAERLAPAPREPRAHGYGVLPPERASQSVREVEPERRTYDIGDLSTWYVTDLRDAAVLATRALAEPDLPLAEAVEQYERLRGRLDNLQDHLDYHAFWQVAALDDTEWWVKRREVLELVRRWRAAEGEEAERLHAQVRERVAPFRTTPGLAFEARDAGHVLPLRVVTDIEDAAFQARLHGAVEGVWNASAAFRSAGLAIALELDVIAPATLYPEGPPAAGDELDEEAHLARFPEGALVVTTGAPSTHARVGRYVQFGPSPLSQRDLAHELGHLLGFVDGYLRAWEDDPDGPYGVKLTEWSGLQGGLMDDSSRGRVTEAMVTQLLEVYGSG